MTKAARSNSAPGGSLFLVQLLLKQIDVSGTALAMAETACQTGLRKVDNPRSKNPEAIHILRENGRLIKERRSAKHIYKGWLSLYEIYESFEKGL